MDLKTLLVGTVLIGGAIFAGTFDEATQQKSSEKTLTKVPAIAKSQTGEEHSVEKVSTQPLEKTISSDAEAIQLVDEAFVAAYEAGDAKAVAAHFTTDAEYVDESGTVFSGRDAIEKCLVGFFEENPLCTLEINTESIRTISPGVVVQDGTTSVTRSESLTPVASRYTKVYVNIDGKWLVASVRDRAPRDLREHATQLEQLGWLKGDWIDESDEAIVSFSCHAVDNGNYLLRKFTIVINGAEAISGTQRIGWDSQTGRLRTWIFDSEGAFGEGLWHRDDENSRWLLKTTGVMADGQTASGTSIYTFVNDDTMTWQSIDHEIAGIQQPDSEIITIVRHAPAPMPVIAADATE